MMCLLRLNQIGKMICLFDVEKSYIFTYFVIYNNMYFSGMIKPNKVQAQLESKKFLRLMYWARKQGYRGLASYVTQHLNQLHDKLEMEGKLPKTDITETE